MMFSARDEAIYVWMLFHLSTKTDNQQRRFVTKKPSISKASTAFNIICGFVLLSVSEEENKKHCRCHKSRIVNQLLITQFWNEIQFTDNITTILNKCSVCMNACKWLPREYCIKMLQLCLQMENYSKKNWTSSFYSVWYLASGYRCWFCLYNDVSFVAINTTYIYINYVLRACIISR